MAICFDSLWNLILWNMSTILKGHLCSFMGDPTIYIYIYIYVCVWVIEPSFSLKASLISSSIAMHSTYMNPYLISDRGRPTLERYSLVDMGSQHSYFAHRGHCLSRMDMAYSGSPKERRRDFIMIYCSWDTWSDRCEKSDLPYKTWNSQTQAASEVWGRVAHCWRHQLSPHHKRSHPSYRSPVITKESVLHEL